MKKTLLFVIIGVFLLSSSSFAEFDYEGRKFGVEFNLGLGFTKGVDGEKLLKDAFGNLFDKIDQSSGATLRFGVKGKFNIVKGFYVCPLFELGFFKEKIVFVTSHGIQVLDIVDRTCR